MTGDKIHFRYVRFYLGPDGHKRINEPMESSERSLRWVSVGHFGGMDITAVRSDLDRDKDAALQFAQDMANELVSKLKPTVRPLEERVRWLAVGHASRFLCDWVPWLSQINRGGQEERRENAVVWLEHMIEQEGSNPVYRRALALVVNSLIKDQVVIPPSFENWDMVAALAPRAAGGQNPERNALREDWERRVGAIVGLMAENSVVQSTGLRPTRNRATTKQSICDMVATALVKKVRQMKNYRSVSRAWDAYRRLPNGRETFFDLAVD